MFNEQVVELIAVMEWLHPGMQIKTEIDHSGGHMKQCADALCTTGKRKFSINLFLLSKLSNNDFIFFVIIERNLEYGGSQEVSRSIKIESESCFGNNPGRSLHVGQTQHGSF
jgi:hypothetical protein